jgi:hypothetical protein
VLICNSGTLLQARACREVPFSSVGLSASLSTLGSRVRIPLIAMRFPLLYLGDQPGFSGVKCGLDANPTDRTQSSCDGHNFLRQYVIVTHYQPELAGTFPLAQSGIFLCYIYITQSSTVFKSGIGKYVLFYGTFFNSIRNAGRLYLLGFQGIFLLRLGSFSLES